MIAAIAALIAYSTFSGSRWRVEVCMSYGGRVSCKKASAKSERNALQAAIGGACADIASGVTDTVNCQQSNPQRVTWLQRHD